MAVSGDLASIDLADLLQNIQTHARTGTLSLSGEDGCARIFFREGNIAQLAADGRPSLGEMLVAAGHVTQRRLEAAQKKQRGTHRCAAEVLVGSRAIGMETLVAAAEDFLTEDVANLIASATGEFEFDEGDQPAQGFDSDEASLRLALPVAPMILEATRRVDHWAEIRKVLPSDSMHFQAREGAQCPADVEDQELAAGILLALDGSRSVKEVADRFPNRRFLTYKLLSDFVRDRLARPTGTDDLLAIAKRIEVDDLVRARQLVRRGLDSEPHHPGLLAAEARLAEQDGDATAAAAACKLLAHLELENGQSAEALQHLEQAKRLTPNDPTLWERTLALALSQGRRQDAVAEGLRLLELYRAPGLHTRAKEVLERLLEVDPESVELHLEFARSRVDCGESPAAVKHLARRGKVFVGQANYLAARSLYQEILDIEPGNREATLSIELIDKETFARRRERKRRVVRWFATGCVAAVVGTAVTLEVLARWEYVEMRSLISRERMIERQQYADASLLLQRLRTDHPFTLTALLDVPRYLADLEQRQQEIGPDVRAVRR